MTEKSAKHVPDTYRDVTGNLGLRPEVVTCRDGTTSVRLVAKDAKAQADFQRNMWEFASGK